MDKTAWEALDTQTQQQVALALRFAEDIQVNLDAILKHKEHVSVVVHGQDIAHHLLSPPSRGVPEGLWTSLAQHEALLSEIPADQDDGNDPRETDACEEHGMEEDSNQAGSANKRARTPVENDEACSTEEGHKAPRLAENDEQLASTPDETVHYQDAPNPKTVRESERARERERERDRPQTRILLFLPRVCTL
jgi:hypothetical protein